MVCILICSMIFVWMYVCACVYQVTVGLSCRVGRLISHRLIRHRLMHTPQHTGTGAGACGGRVPGAATAAVSYARSFLDENTAAHTMPPARDWGALASRLWPRGGPRLCSNKACAAFAPDSSPRLECACCNQVRARMCVRTCVCVWACVLYRQHVLSIS